MAGVFISYRKDDTAPWAVMLRDRLVETFGVDQVFLDVDAIGLGDWRDQVDRRLTQCRVELVLIGRSWVTSRDPRGRPRLFLDDDVHRAEVATALARESVTVVPVLLDGAPMPRVEELPDDLKALTRRQAIELRLSGARRAMELNALVRQLETLTGQARLKRLAWVTLCLAMVLGVLNSSVNSTSRLVGLIFLVMSVAVLAIAAWTSWQMHHDRMKGAWPAFVAAGMSLTILVGSLVRLSVEQRNTGARSLLTVPASAEACATALV